MKSEKPAATPPAPAVSPPAAAASPDVALVHAVSEDGSVHVIRKRGEQLEAGALQPLREGAPIQGEVVSLRPRQGFPLLCDVDVHYKPPAPAAPALARRKGPAQVATDTYRDNWDSIWSRKKSESLN